MFACCTDGASSGQSGQAKLKVPTQPCRCLTRRKGAHHGCVRHFGSREPSRNLVSRATLTRAGVNGDAPAGMVSGRQTTLPVAHTLPTYGVLSRRHWRGRLAIVARAAGPVVPSRQSLPLPAARSPSPRPKGIQVETRTRRLRRRQRSNVGQTRSVRRRPSPSLSGETKSENLGRHPFEYPSPLLASPPMRGNRRDLGDGG